MKKTPRKLGKLQLRTETVKTLVQVGQDELARVVGGAGDTDLSVGFGCTAYVSCVTRD